MPKDSSQPHPRLRPHEAPPRLPPADVILEAAERVAEQGFDALTMRAVAARLGAVPMALYGHFPTKQRLVDALLDRVLGRFEPPPRHRRLARGPAHPSRAPTGACSRPIRGRSRRCSRQPSPGLSSVRIGEQGLEILRARRVLRRRSPSPPSAA